MNDEVLCNMQGTPKLHIYSSEMAADPERRTSHLEFNASVPDSLHLSQVSPIEYLSVNETGLTISAHFAATTDDTIYSVHTIVEVGTSAPKYYQELITLKVINNYGELSVSCTVWPSEVARSAGISVDSITVTSLLPDEPRDWNEVSCILHPEIRGNNPLLPYKLCCGG